jgi:hypothetical protein
MRVLPFLLSSALQSAARRLMMKSLDELFAVDHVQDRGDIMPC